jgi:hypothetical protein
MKYDNIDIWELKIDLISTRFDFEQYNYFNQIIVIQLYSKK